MLSNSTNGSRATGGRAVDTAHAEADSDAAIEPSLRWALAGKLLAAALERSPYTYAGLMLAWAAMGNFFLTPDAAGLRVLFGAGSLLILLLIVCKVLARPASLAEASRNPVVWSAFATFYMGVMVLSTYLADAMPGLGRGLWALAIVGQACHMVHFAGRHLSRMPVSGWFPTFMIVYVGVGVGAITAPFHHMEAVGRVVVVFAAVCLVVLFPLLVYRYLRYPAPPAPLAPTFCIFTAPFSIVLAGYCRCYAEPNMALVLGLWACSLTAYAVVAAHVPGFVRNAAKFSPTLACLTFPFTVSARATLWVGNVIEAGGVLAGLLPVARALFYMQLLIAILLLGYATVRFARQSAGV